MQEIVVRHSESKDIPGIKAIFKGKTIYSNTLQLPYSSIEKWESQFETPQAGYYSLVAELDEDIVGHTGLKVDQNPARNHIGSCGIAVKDSHHRKGIGNKMLAAMVDLSDNWLNQKRLELSTYTDNEAAIGLYRKYGFEIEGESPCFAFRDGAYASAYPMGRVRNR